MLAGLPVRFSPNPDLAGDIPHDGFIKLRLGHSHRGSVIVPDLIFSKAGPWRFFRPSFLGPCCIGFNVEEGLHLADFSVDVGSPRVTQPRRLQVRIRSDEHVKAYADGSQLYRCELRGPPRLAPHASGRCSRLDNGDFALTLFHHTNPNAYAKIRASQELWASAWNIQGTRRLINVAYVYFTSLPKIERPEDLKRIAMSSDGVIDFNTTSNRPVEEMLRLTVHRGSTAGRTKRIEVEVPSAFLAPPHLYLHPLVWPSPAYYEVVGPEIFRVGLRPGAKLPIRQRRAEPRAADVKRFEYIVLGDTSDVTGLAAPYDEEDTRAVMHHERLDQGLDLFEFWLANANSDQVSGRTFEARMLERAEAERTNPATGAT